MAKRKAPKNTGRGRLSTIDLLPEECDDDIIWVNEELRDNKRPQTEILSEFNERLAEKGQPPISAGAFSRYSVRKATQFRDMDETRRVAVELAESLGADSADKMTITLAEMTKAHAIKLLERGQLTPQDIHFLSKAAKDAASAQKTSAQHRQQIEREYMSKVEEVASEIGVSDDMIDRIRKGVLGVQ